MPSPRKPFIAGVIVLAFGFLVGGFAAYIALTPVSVGGLACGTVIDPASFRGACYDALTTARPVALVGAVVAFISVAFIAFPLTLLAKYRADDIADAEGAFAGAERATR